MTSRSIYNSLVPLATLALCGSMALAQQTPQPTPPADSSNAPAAPIERHAPPPDGMRGPRPGMMGRQGGPGMMRHEGNRGPGEGMGGGMHIGPMGMWWKNPRVVETLSLTPDQVKRMDGIFQESRLKLIDLRANVQKQEVMLEPLLSANPVDSAKAMVQIDKVAEGRADLEKANARMLLGIRGVLTPDQWTKLHDRRGAGEHGGPGEGRGRGPQPGDMDNLAQPDLLP
jgi:Spy/CpxP family protein refolding chaperone